MAKQIAFLEYSFIFDPSESWSNGYQFENQLADFFGAHGFEAQIVQTAGGSGRRVIFLNRIAISTPKQMPQDKKTTPVVEQIKKVQAQAPTKSFKQFQKPQIRENKINPLSFRRVASDLRQEIRQLPHINFKGVKK